MFRKIKALISLLRMKQWAKNFFIFFPLIFSGQVSNLARLADTLWTFIGFCLCSSSIYILNDYLDRKKDRLHPRKSKRPLASRVISGPAAVFYLFSVMALGIWICLKVDPLLLYTAVVYIYLNLIYNYWSKHVVILDVIFVAVGFQLRIWAGSFAAGVIPSVWLQLCVFLLALFLGFTKRRHEISSLGEHAPEHRGVLSHYTTYLLDQNIIICSALTIVFYGLYCISSDIIKKAGGENMVYSIPFVIYGIFRYLYLVHVKKLGDDPGETIFADGPILICILLWVLFVYATLYR